MSLELALMLVSFGLLVTAGLQLSFSMIISCAVYLLMKGDPLYLIVHNFFRGVDTFTLMAIPFFILAGEIMVYSGAAERMLEFANRLVGRIRGGLGYVNVLTSMVFGGCSGSAISDVAALGPLEIRMMEKGGYSREFSAALTISSAVQGPIIPPSIPLVLIGAVTGTSIGGLLIGGAVPGVLIAIAQFVTVFFVCRRMPAAGGKFSAKSLLLLTLEALPFLLMPLIIVGGIISGIFTPTEASAAAVAYGLFLAVVYLRGRLNAPNLKKILVRSAVLSAAILWLAGASSVFGWVLASERVPVLLAEGLLTVSDNPIIILLIINVFLLFWGMVMDMLPAILIVVPVLMPLAEQIGIHPIHFGVVVTVNLVIGLITPPYGAALFTGSVVSGVPIERLVRPMLPFIGASILVLMIITYVPETVMFLPRLLGLDN